MTSVTYLIDLKVLASPAFSLDLFDREVIEPSLPGQTKRVDPKTCNVWRCNKSYSHPYPGNTSTLLSHQKSKHRSELLYLGKRTIDSGNPREETGSTNLLERLTHVPSDISKYSKLDIGKFNRKPDYKVTKPAHANCSFGWFKKLFTRFLIGLDMPLNACEYIISKRMLDSPRICLLKVVWRWHMTLQLKNLYTQKVASLKKQSKEYDGRFSALPMDVWKAGKNSKFWGIAVHFLNKYFVLESYHIELVHIPKKNGNAESLPKYKSTWFDISTEMTE